VCGGLTIYHVKVLIIKLGALGDVVMSAPLVDRILASHDDAECWMLTAPVFAEFYAAWETLEVKTMARHGMRAFFDSLGWIRRQGFDRLYDLQSSNRTGVLCALAGVSERVGNHPRFPYTHHPETIYTRQTHIFERMNTVLQSAGLAPAAAQPHIPVSGTNQQRVSAWLNERGLRGQSIVLLHAGASAGRPEKRWPHFSDLATRLKAAGHVPVWIGAGPDSAINARLAQDCGIDATDAFNIVELVALGRNSAFAVTNDSGPMHILSAAGLPVFAFFGPSDWRRNHALGQEQRVFSNPDLAAITVDSVVERLRAEKLL